MCTDDRQQRYSATELTDLVAQMTVTIYGYRRIGPAQCDLARQIGDWSRRLIVREGRSKCDDELTRAMM